MVEIARKVGLNKATLYLYFENKDHLLFAIILRTMKDLISRYGECSRLDITGREKYRLMAKTFIEFTRENPDYFRTIGAVGPKIFNDTDNPIVKRILELQEQQFGMFRDALSEGIVDGTVRDDLDPLQMATSTSRVLQPFASIRPCSMCSLLGGSGSIGSLRIIRTSSWGRWINRWAGRRPRPNHPRKEKPE